MGCDDEIVQKKMAGHRMWKSRGRFITELVLLNLNKASYQSLAKFTSTIKMKKMQNSTEKLKHNVKKKKQSAKKKNLNAKRREDRKSFVIFELNDLYSYQQASKKTRVAGLWSE